MIEIDSSQGRHTRYLRLAEKIARKNSDFPTYKHAAVIVRGGRIISIGINKLRPGIAKHPAYAKKAHHSELDAVLGIDPDILRGSTIYIAGISSRSGNLVTSKPCECCQQMLRDYNIKTAVYHTGEGTVEFWKVS